MEKYERIKEKPKVLSMLMCSTQAVTFLFDVLVVFSSIVNVEL